MDEITKTFLEQNRHGSMEIYLTNGIKLKGLLDNFDADGLLLSNPDHGTQLIRLSAIATIQPKGAF